MAEQNHDLSLPQRVGQLLIVEVDAHAPAVVFPSISIDRARNEFGFVPRSIMADLSDLVADFRKVVPVK